MNEKKYDITKMVTISTGHIKESTVEFLDNSLILSIYRTPYNYTIWIENDTKNYFEDCKTEIPNDLWACIMFAHNLDCQWLCLDGDGEIVDELPVYEWEN